ncbi:MULTISPECIES: UDP-4-amino-4,6-dideoxy-N-acetyl-beta-L-altrosamine N-acetyltransferase [Gammaproteobacteria]|uniref:UDP-4-amino-4, 6-dideoxy-N-acetyl-beta-L-altrosamine N-acetyltransferase n=1 Tax=Gammaproteobacteria TaxID=1236 RepID=UPI001403CE71|nr:MULTISPECIES: UDP-4-amino-4,6-dideoxy-N-acetyl-beta-L-altrosamine N-acetyltransferase [Gammaproteobacteria]
MKAVVPFQRYGVTLKRLEEDMLEQVRSWRNSPEVAKHMLQQGEISKEQQENWYQGLQEDDSRIYWVAWFKEQPIGVASLTKIDLSKGSAEPGMYIYPEQFKNNIIPFCVAFALNDFAFEELGLTTLVGKIFVDNEASVRFHEKCGYKSTSQITHVEEQQKDLQWYSLNRKDYEAAKAPIARFIRY